MMMFRLHTLLSHSIEETLLIFAVEISIPLLWKNLEACILGEAEVLATIKVNVVMEQLMMSKCLEKLKEFNSIKLLRFQQEDTTRFL